ncbi:MAG: pirin family protein [Chloroflexi bacterium]|nr:pirin family protein [Chloroflexota bacterium]
MYDTVLKPNVVQPQSLQHFRADAFPSIHPVHWLHSHFAVGGWSPLQRLSGMLTAHMTRIAPRNGFTWHPHRGLEIYTWILQGTLHHEDTTGGEGDIGAGEFQRMFSGDWIEHQELNLTDDPVRVIQIWFAADIKHRGLPPHYQQLREDELPAARDANAATYQLIGNGSPMERHIVAGRLTATHVDPGGATPLDPPRTGEDLFVYVTDGAGRMSSNGDAATLGQYDVILARPDAPATRLAAAPGECLHFLNFYLPRFLP